MNDKEKMKQEELQYEAEIDDRMSNMVEDDDFEFAGVKCSLREFLGVCMDLGFIDDFGVHDLLVAYRMPETGLEWYPLDDFLRTLDQEETEEILESLF
jgi:hypothetical protein